MGGPGLTGPGLGSAEVCVCFPPGADKVTQMSERLCSASCIGTQVPPSSVFALSSLKCPTWKLVPASSACCVKDILPLRPSLTGALWCFQVLSYFYWLGSIKKKSHEDGTKAVRSQMFPFLVPVVTTD